MRRFSCGQNRLISGCAPLALVLMMLSPACETPVDSDVTLTITGRVLLPDGSPAVGQLVQVQKSDLEPISFNWVIGNVINEDVEPFKTTTTDTEGRYSFSFLGKEANSGNGYWAAYFRTYAVKGDGEAPMAVATDSFTFSSSAPDKAVPDMRFIELDATNVVADKTADVLRVTWDRDKLPQDANLLVVQVGAADWVAEVDGESWELPLAALEPCIASIDAGTCTPLAGDAVRITVIAGDLNYRTNWQAFVQANTKGTGINYTSPDDDSSGTTCSGMPLYKLNDGKHDVVLSSDFGKNASQADLRCLQFPMGEARDLSWFFLHNGLVFEHKQVTVRVSTSTSDTPDAPTYTEWGRLSMADQQFWQLNMQLKGPRPGVKWLRIEMDGPADKTLWFGLGEVTVY